MDISPLSTTAPAAKPAAPDLAAAEKAGQEFEALMVGQMLESMFAGVETGNAFGGGEGERTWRSFMLQEYGKAIAEAGTLGIGRMVQADVARLYGQSAEGTEG
ncbi:rod-binding protein [Roseomonas genomospecies 6]|uniref:Flagellar biosynthesis protein FlgJ n=1 Tax=Roseomonas genomospecies 6 TaxID=214106 RepID=A0A9W7KNB1_9PROT|nr:rod-binding protein [Roseomonas genomospecies 6]KAA0676088.1 flagellar biosynthesis protein FlgJ [Roseomonas genomospecies 6]